MILPLWSVLSLTWSPVASRAQTPPPQPTVVFGQPGVAPLTPLPPPRRKKKKRSGDSKGGEMPDFSSLAKGAGGGGGGGSSSSGGGSGGGGGVVNPGGAGGGADPDGRMQDCGTLPDNVAGDLKEMMKFRDGCSLANKGADQKMAINEYRCGATPMMYIFDSSGKCLKKMAVTYGSGKENPGDKDCPKACDDNNSRFTPPGFHLTVTHFGSPKKDGKKWYGPNNSLGLSGLEGQISDSKRGILIHEAAAPGTPSSWGCSGIATGNLMDVLNTLRTGALVYNAFSADQLSSGCRSKAGITHNASACRSEGGATSSGSRGGGSSGSAR